jgi:RinA family phage transcriptional activator
MKIRSGTIAYLEDELTHYHETVREIEKLKNDILHQGRSSLGGDEGGRGSGPSDPTALIAIELSSNARIVRLEHIADVIDSVVSQLHPIKRKLIQVMYWDRPRQYTWQGAAIHLHIHKATAHRWRKEILHELAHRGGFY